MGDKGLLVRNSAGQITRREIGLLPGDTAVTELKAGDVHAISRSALPIRVKSVRVRNRAGKLVGIPHAELLRGDLNTSIYIMHNSKDLDCDRRVHVPVRGPQAMLRRLPCQWTWFTTAVCNMWVDEPFGYVGDCTNVQAFKRNAALNYMSQAAAADAFRLAAMDFERVELAFAASTMNTLPTKYIMGIDYSTEIKALHDEMARSTGIPLELRTKQEEKMGSGTYDKKVLTEKLTVAMNIHAKAINDELKASRERAHEALDKVLETGDTAVISDIIMATALVKVADYKDMLEELSLLAGDSVKGSDLSRDPLNLIRAAGDVKPLKSRLRVERI